jgi:excisionase family DNA binding protein
MRQEENSETKFVPTEPFEAKVDGSILTPSEVATQLRVTTEQVRCLIRQGRLSAINVGTGPKRPLYRITQQALNDFLNRRQQSSPAIQKRKFKRPVSTPDFFPHLE